MVHSFTNSSLELYYFSLSISLSFTLCVCVFVCACVFLSFQSEANTGGYGAPSPKHCVTTSQQDEQTLLSHLWTSGESVHSGNVCTVLVSELRKEYVAYLESNAVLEDRKILLEVKCVLRVYWWISWPLSELKSRLLLDNYKRCVKMFSLKTLKGETIFRELFL